MTRGTALVTSVARVMALTAVQDLSGLASADFVIADQLIIASDIVYDRLVADGVDPTALSNADHYERTVAWVFVGRCCSAGNYVALPTHRIPSPEAFAKFGDFAYAEPEYRGVKPVTTGDEDPRFASEPRPVVLNHDGFEVYSEERGRYRVVPDPTRWRDQT